MLQGIIDLLAVKDGKAIIVDYKYSGKSKEDLILTYQKQLKLYKKAVEDVLGVQVEKTAIVSLIGAEVIEID